MSAGHSPPKPTAFHVSFDKDIASSFKTLLRLTSLPTAAPISTTAPWQLGIDLPWLAPLKQKLESEEWRVDDLERRINQWPNYLVRIKADEGEDGGQELDVHFVHVKSRRKDAIPLMLLHGWPGTFWDFHKVIDPLTNPPDGQPAFDVVIPSLPGYFLSTQPQRADWTLVDTAKLFNRLMTNVLGYSRYAGQGGDWGSYILRAIGSLYPSQAPLLHFNMLHCPFVPGADEQYYTESEKKSMKGREENLKTGQGYTAIQSTKPFTIGLAIGTSPVALLAYIGEKMYTWSDPSTLDPADVLDTVALYYLSRSFATSVMIYQQSSSVRPEMTDEGEVGRGKWRVGSKMGFTLFPYEFGASPRAYIEAVGPLVFYKERTVGGHFPALDNPKGLVEDIVEFIGGNWESGVTAV